MPTWIFGYGSIIWRPDFPHVERRLGWVEGYARRFWQGSPDHRGTPTALGRVCTLVPDEAHGARCWGMAYRLPPEKEDEVMAYLDHRERGGYVRLDVEFSMPRDGGATTALSPISTTTTTSTSSTVVSADKTTTTTTSTSTTTLTASAAALAAAAEHGTERVRAITYIASPNNDHYLGPSPLTSMAAQIAVSHGESGWNADYVLNLARGLSELGLDDEHVAELALAVQEAASAAANATAAPVSVTATTVTATPASPTQTRVREQVSAAQAVRMQQEQGSPAQVARVLEKVRAG